MAAQSTDSIGGRYGSVGPSGLSYTEMEYRYAVELGKPVLAFVHKDPRILPAFKVDSNPEPGRKLAEFRTQHSARCVGSGQRHLSLVVL